MEQVALIGAGQTAFVPRNAEQSIPEMVAEAVDAALVDAGLELSEVDAAVTASVDLWDGRTASNVALTEVVGAVLGPETRLAADGLAAFAHAAMTVAAGAYETVLCVAHCKPSESDHQALTAWTLDPVLLQPLGLDCAAAAGLQAAAASGVPGAWAEAVAAPLCDGAAAVVAGRPRAGAGPRITGLGYATESHYLGDRDLVGVPALRAAAQRAGVEPRKIAVAQISAPYAHQEELFARALGIVPDLVNPSGGTSAGAPPFVAGLARLIAAAGRLRPGQRGLAHGTWGPAGQAHCVVGLEV